VNDGLRSLPSSSWISSINASQRPWASRRGSARRPPADSWPALGPARWQFPGWRVFVLGA
jgi:hypothetical protein